MQPKATQQIALHQGQALALCWLLQQPLRAGGEVLAGITRTLAFSRPLSGTDWAAVPPPLGVHLDLSTRLTIDVLIAYGTGYSYRESPATSSVSQPLLTGQWGKGGADHCVFRPMSATDSG